MRQYCPVDFMASSSARSRRQQADLEVEFARLESRKRVADIDRESARRARDEKFKDFSWVNGSGSHCDYTGVTAAKFTVRGVAYEFVVQCPPDSDGRHRIYGPALSDANKQLAREFVGQNPIFVVK